MSYLKFSKSILKNTHRAIIKEWLETNKLGTYSSSSIIGCNTRKYHGLFVCPIKNLDNQNHVLISSLDESVLMNNVEFKLGVHQYGDGFYEPTGNKYLCSLTYDKTPCFLYRLGNIIISKDILVSSSENRVYVKYTLLDSDSDTVLRFSPNLAFRNVNMLCQSNYNATTESKSVDNGISVCLYSGYPTLYMQFDKDVQFTPKQSWNRGVEYYKEQWRGYNYKEDLFVPGYFETKLSKGESLIFTAGLEEADSCGLNGLYKSEIVKKPSNDSLKDILNNAISKHYVKTSSKDFNFKAGLPWFDSRARDLFVSLPGITLPFDNSKLFESVLSNIVPSVKNFMKGNGNKTNMCDFDNPDIFLWITRSLQLYSEKYSKEQTWKKYGDLLKLIVDYYKNSKHPLVEFQDNGLLYVKDGWHRPLTWMNSSQNNGYPITPRSGYVVEINSLWYNALRFLAELLKMANDDKSASEYDELADRIRENFTPIFWNGSYLKDFVDGDHHEVSVRPNMLFAVSLPYSPIDEIQKKMVVDMATKELLTPKGIRSLSPKSQNYHGWCGGNQTTRDYESFQGAVYPWLMGAYVDAYIKVYGESGLDFAKRSMYAFTGELSNECLGTISEMYDATQPFTGRGGMSYLMNIAEVSRVLDGLGIL